MVKCVNKDTREPCDIDINHCDVQPKCEIVPDISIVIPALNERHHIESLLESISDQETEYDFETVIADNGSTDGTFEFLNGRSDVRVIREERKGIPFARNCGVKEARSPYILQTDADVILPNDWVEKMGKELIEGKKDIVGGSVAFDSNNSIQKAIASSAFNVIIPLFNEVQRFVPNALKNNTFAGANMGYSREMYNKIGGFDEKKMWFEDNDFTTRSHKKGAKSSFLWDNSVLTSSRRFGDNSISTIWKLTESALVLGFRKLGIEPKRDYERVD